MTAAIRVADSERFIPDGKPCCQRIGSAWCWRVDEHAVPGECEGAGEREIQTMPVRDGRRR